MLLIAMCNERIAVPLQKQLYAHRPPQWRDVITWDRNTRRLQAEITTTSDRLEWYKGFASGYICLKTGQEVEGGHA